jgi:predicted nucleic acid-binding protein
MKALLDSSTLIAGMLTDHVHHAPAHAWIVQAKNGAYEFVVSGHSLAEVYSVLTRLPRIPQISPADAWQLVKDNVTSCATIITLQDRDYVALIEELSLKGLSGGLVYDAIIAKAAELSKVDTLVTLNEAHFMRVWPTGAAKIVSPLSTSPPAATSP